VAEPRDLLRAVAHVADGDQSAVGEPKPHDPQELAHELGGVRCGRPRARSSSSERYSATSIGRAHGRVANGKRTRTARTTHWWPYRQAV
jgi:hypothetical protein